MTGWLDGAAVHRSWFVRRRSPRTRSSRDTTEQVIVSSKGRFDRVLPARERTRRGIPSEVSMTRDDFMENTLDLWEISSESATRVGYLAPFFVEMPSRLIRLYIYSGDAGAQSFRWVGG